jgi:hypothetical protein
MANALHPQHMKTGERVQELAEILAHGLIRLQARQSSRISADRGDCRLDFSPDQRGHGPVTEAAEPMS